MLLRALLIGSWAALLGLSLPLVERLGRQPPTPSTPEPITLVFVGDMMFDRYVRERAVTIGYDTILAHVSLPHGPNTLLFGNLEGPITDFAPVSDYREKGPNHFRFTFATSVASTLSTYGFSAVTLANNHIVNFGKEGVAQTKDWLTRAGVGFVGAPGEYLPWKTEVGTRTIALYAYDEWNNNDLTTLTKNISSEATSTFTIVFAHWGDEYSPTPNARQVRTAHALIDAGADFVVGAHPHVIQTKERYRDVWIYYSLGNFVFDQYFTSEVRCGAVVTLTLAETTYHPEESFIELKRDGTTATSSCKGEVPEV